MAQTTPRSLAERLKGEGNTLFVQGKFAEAVEKFTAAIDQDPAVAAYYTNRCAAYHKLSKFEDALVDAEKACEVDPTWAKGFVRKAQILVELQRADDALETLHKVAERFIEDADFAATVRSIEVAAKKQQEFKGDVVDFAVHKSIGEKALKSNDIDAASNSYNQTLAVMEKLIASLPAEKADELRNKLQSTKALMKDELSAAKSATGLKKV